MKKMMIGTGYVKLKMMTDQLIIFHTNIVMNMMMECLSVNMMMTKKMYLHISMRVVIPNIMNGN